MLRNFDYAPCFDEVHQARTPTARSAQPPAASASWPIVSALRAMWDQLGEGLAAHRHYERLRSRGVPHATALRESLGMGSPQCAPPIN
jgi:hypothetical protein